METTSIQVQSPEETADIATAFSAVVRPKDTILLKGDVGVGKSHFARRLIQSKQLSDFGSFEDVPSPTFTLVQTYQTTSCDIWHVDLYRINHTDELIEIGLDMAIGTDICLIEWPDRLGILAPKDALHLTIELLDENCRNLHFHWSGDSWSTRLLEILNNREISSRDH